MFEYIKSKLFKRKPKRIELKFVDYREGDRLIREGWSLAPEEDDNKVFGMVFVEKLESK